jgi:hypothetical protein
MGLGHGPLILTDNIMEMRIDNNTEHTLSTVQIYLEWNHDTGHQQGEIKSLRLRQITLGEQAWNGDLYAPSKYISGFYPVIPPGTSTIRFFFDQDYELADGTERIIITIGTPGCTNYPIDSQR